MFFVNNLFKCFQESKRSFLHSVVNEGGDKEKLESFVNFCEDTIFEVRGLTTGFIIAFSILNLFIMFIHVDLNILLFIYYLCVYILIKYSTLHVSVYVTDAARNQHQCGGATYSCPQKW